MLSDSALTHTRSRQRFWKWVLPLFYRGLWFHLNREAVMQKGLIKVNVPSGRPLEDERLTNCPLFMSKAGGHADSRHPGQTTEAG